MRYSLSLGLVTSVVASATYGDYFFMPCKAMVGENSGIVRQCPNMNTNPGCLCSSVVFQQSLLSCIVNASDIAGIEYGATETSWSAFRHNCRVFGAADRVPELAAAMQTLQNNPPALSFAEVNSTGSNATFYVTRWDLYNANVPRAGKALHTEMYAADTYGQALLAYVMGLMAVASIVNVVTWILPQLCQNIGNTVLGRSVRTWVTMPALFGKRKAQPYKFLGVWYFVLPQRSVTLMILGYLVVTGILLGVQHPVQLSPYIYTTKREALLSGFSKRSALFAMYNAPLVFLFAGRNNLLISLTGLSFDFFNVWHRWLARIFIVELIVHAVVCTLLAEMSHSLGSQWKMAYFIWGFMALFFAGIMSFIGSKTIRSQSYDFFKVTHIVLAVFVITGTWYHIQNHWYGREQLIACISLWSFDRFIRLLRVICSSGKGARTTVLSHHEDGVTEVTIEHSGLWQPNGGDYVFVHFLTLSQFWQSHPFTVIEPARLDETGRLKLFCKARFGITHRLHHSNIKPTRVWLDGPYGVRINMTSYYEVVLLAGGIGITSVYSHLLHCLKHGPPKQRICVHWTVASVEPLNWFREHLRVMSSHDRVNILVHISGVPNKTKVEKATRHTFIQWGRLDIDRLVSHHAKKSHGPTCFFVCGPDRMNDQVRRAVINAIPVTRNYIQFYEEAFTM